MSTGKNNGQYQTRYSDPSIGATFCNWIVTGETARSPNSNNRICLCRCICGSERKVFIRDLHAGHSKGCGCIRRGRRLRPYEALYQLLVRQARRRGYSVGISYDDFVKFTDVTSCHYCGQSVSWCPFNIIKNQSSRHNIDRADNTRGYELDNCIVCCGHCNAAKSDHFTYDEWKQIGAVIRSWKK